MSATLEHYKWLASGDTGASSETIWVVMTGEQPGRCSSVGYEPMDAGDFGRCYRLLRRFPEWRARLGEVAERFPRWRPLVAHWDELTALYESELKLNSDFARSTTARIRELTK